MRPAARDVTLADGSAVTFRAIEAGDAKREVAFIAGLSPRSGYNRAFRPLKYVAPEDIVKLTQVDFERDMAIVAVHRRTDGEEEIVGVGRYVRDDDPACAEFALTVADRCHRLGLGGLLLRALFDTARAHGIRRLHGLILRANASMLALAREEGFRLAPMRGDATVVNATKDL
jgi:acetyltransferase